MVKINLPITEVTVWFNVKLLDGQERIFHAFNVPLPDVGDSIMVGGEYVILCEVIKRVFDYSMLR